MLLDVERRGDAWAVVPHVIERDNVNADAEPLRTFDNQAPAWHMACWHQFEQDDTLPKIGPGGWFASTSGPAGWTSDPRFAVTVPADSVDENTAQRIDKSVIRFIRHKMGAVDDMEVFMPEDQQPENVEPTTDEPWEYPEPEGADVRTQHADDDGPEVYAEDDADTSPEVPESDSEALGEDDGATTPEDPDEALRDALSDSDRNAFDNFAHLAENAPSEAGRAFWSERAADVLHQ